MPLPKSESQGPEPRAESGTELGIDEITEGQVLDRESASGQGSSNEAAGPQARIGDMLVGRYRLERIIAKGGMGRVYLATQLPLERQVAIKLLIAKGYDEEFRKRFFLEASTCARLVHRHIVTVHDYGEAENGELFMAMEFLDGEPLSKVIAREIRLDSDRACQIALQICRALRAAHKSGIVHRDLKPGNVMLLHDEEQEHVDFVKVLDFGLVKTFDANPDDPAADLTRSGTWLGSPRYMAPEQIRCQEVDPRTDIYSLGVILFHMVAGRPPFVGPNSVEILQQHLQDPVPNIRDLVGQIHYPPELEEIIRTCLAKDPAHRYQSMDAVIRDLKAVYRISTGVSIHTESSLPTFHDAQGEADSDSGSVRGSTRPRAATLSTRPPPAPPLGPPPDLGLGGSSRGTPPAAPPDPAEASGSGPGRTPPPPLNLDSISGDLEPGSGPRRWAILALLLASVVLAGFFITRGLLQTPRATPAPVVLTILSHPLGAEVVNQDGQVLGRTPLTVTLPGASRGSRQSYRIRMMGHDEAVVDALLDRDRVAAQVKLRRIAPAPDLAAESPPAVEAVPPAVPPSEPTVRSAPRRAPVVQTAPPSRRSDRAGGASRRRQRQAPSDAPAEALPAPQPEPAAQTAPVSLPEALDAPRSVPTVDETRHGLVVDEGEGTTVIDTPVPVVD